MRSLRSVELIRSLEMSVLFSLIRTGVEQGGRADLSDGACQLEAGRPAAGIQDGGTSCVVLQLHPVEI